MPPTGPWIRDSLLKSRAWRAPTMATLSRAVYVSSTLRPLRNSLMLINSVAYQEGNRIRDVPLDGIDACRREEKCFVWVALKDAESGEIDRLHEIFELPDLAVEDARHGHQRPKLEEYGDQLFVALHLLEHRPHRFAHLRRVQRVQVLRRDHGGRSCRHWQPSGIGALPD